MSEPVFEKPDANWWRFSVGDDRGEKILDDPGAGTVEINPDLDGRRLLSYAGYLRLDRLLGAQVPSSRAPEERVFVVTHQLVELVFKQAIFDLGVIAATLRRLLELDAAAFGGLVAGSGDATGDATGEARTHDFWIPALTAAARVRHGLRDVLPQLIGYLADEETFDNREFAARFRVNLAPASGFQSAQLRLIQRALGKSPLLRLPIFPADTYLKNYSGLGEREVVRLILESETAGLASVTDELILREQAPIAAPRADSPLHAIAQLDDLAHAVLALIGGEAAPEQEACAAPQIPPDGTSAEGVAATFQRRLRESLEGIRRRKDASAVLSAEDEESIRRRGEVFARHWAAAAAQENERRRTLGAACRGAWSVLRREPAAPLLALLDRLAAADDALCGDFLSYHQKFVRRRIGELPGTAGGGVPFLELSRTLAAQFPALIAFRAARAAVDKGDAGT